MDQEGVSVVRIFLVNRNLCNVPLRLVAVYILMKMSKVMGATKKTTFYFSLHLKIFQWLRMDLQKPIIWAIFVGSICLTIRRKNLLLGKMSQVSSEEKFFSDPRSILVPDYGMPFSNRNVLVTNLIFRKRNHPKLHDLRWNQSERNPRSQLYKIFSLRPRALLHSYVFTFYALARYLRCENRPTTRIFDEWFCRRYKLFYYQKS